MLKQFAVIGSPIEHSLSPFIHQRFAAQFGLELSYEKKLGEQAHFEVQVQDFFAKGGMGLNITLPFKERAFALATYRTPRCKRAAAANTLWSKGGEIYADNTDGIGLIHDLANYLSLLQKRVLILGAGGAARGIIGPLLDEKPAELILVNRTLDKAKKLGNEFPGINVCSFSELEGSFDLLINATSASISHQQLLLSPSLLSPQSFCYDLAYHREKPTPFVSWAREHSIKAVDGLGMLVEQAAEAFFIWHQLRPETNPVKVELCL